MSDCGARPETERGPSCPCALLLSRSAAPRSSCSCIRITELIFILVGPVRLRNSFLKEGLTLIAVEDQAGIGAAEAEAV